MWVFNWWKTKGQGFLPQVSHIISFSLSLSLCQSQKSTTTHVRNLSDTLIFNVLPNCIILFYRFSKAYAGFSNFILGANDTLMISENGKTVLTSFTKGKKMLHFQAVKSCF